MGKNLWNKNVDRLFSSMYGELFVNYLYVYACDRVI